MTFDTVHEPGTTILEEVAGAAPEGRVLLPAGRGLRLRTTARVGGQAAMTLQYAGLFEPFYVTGTDDFAVRKYGPNGEAITSFGGPNSPRSPGRLTRPYHLDLDPYGRLHVADWSGHRIAVFTSDGEFVAEYGTPAMNPGGEVRLPVGIAIAGSRVLVGAQSSNAVIEYALRTTAPQPPAILSPVAGAQVLTTTPLVLARGSPGGSVELLEAGAVLAAGQVTDPSGLIALKSPALSLGVHNLGARTVSNLGHPSAPSPAVNVAVARAEPLAFDFAAPELKRVSAAPYSGIIATTTVTADFDSDGLTDILALGRWGYAVFLGRGQGSFEQLPAVLWSAAGVDLGYVSRALAADFNGDGNQDLVAAGGGQLKVVAGKGDGTFRLSELVVVPTDLGSTGELTAADFNGDGRPDMAAAGSGGLVQILLNRGDGSFGFDRRPAMAVAGQYYRKFSLRAADLDKDGKPDLAASGTVLFGDGLGGFPVMRTVCAGEGSSACRMPLVGDFNRDGNPDLALIATVDYQSKLRVYLGLGDGTFKALADQAPPGTVGALIHGGGLSDLNLDGFEDLAYGRSDGKVGALASAGDGTFATAQLLDSGSPCGQLETLSNSDLNGDGSPDLALALNYASCSWNELSLLINRRLPAETVPPGAVKDLAVTAYTGDSVTLSWSVPASPSAGLASYEFRRSEAPIMDEAAFSAAAALPAVPAPGAFGTRQSLDVSGVTQTAFFAAMRSLDGLGKVSGLSNMAALVRSAFLVDGQPELTVTANQAVSATALPPASPAAAAAMAAAASQGLVPGGSLYELGPPGAAYAPQATLVLRFSASALAAAGLTPRDIAAYEYSAEHGFRRLEILTVDAEQGVVRAVVPDPAAAVGLFGTPRPVVSAVQPGFGPDTGTLEVLVSGAGFREGATLRLSRPAGPATFTMTGSMSRPRPGHAAALLSDGRVLVCGGGGSGSNEPALSSAEIYDPAAGTWSPTGSMAVGRLHHIATVLPNGKVLVTGGRDAATYHSSAELYDPQAGLWSPAGAMSAPRTGHGAVALPDGHVLIAGGGQAYQVYSSAEIFDPGTGAGTPTGPMAVARSGATLTLLDSGKVLAAGGYNLGINMPSSAELYDPVSGTWSPTGSMTDGRSYHTATLLPDGRVLVVGGNSSVATTELYDPAAGLWSQAGSLPNPLSNNTATLLPSGKVLAPGGNWTYGPADAELYDPAAGTWTSLGPLQVPRYAHTATLLQDGRVLLAGGGASETAEVFDMPTLELHAAGVQFRGATELAGTLDLAGKPRGAWDVIVTNPGGLAGTLPGRFTIHGTEPPAAVTDLRIVETTASSVRLAWTAPASPSGALEAYDVRRSEAPIDASNFNDATQVQAPDPGAAGSSETADVAAAGAASFHSALKSRDVYGNESGLSNSVSLARSAAEAAGRPEVAFTASQPVSVQLVPAEADTGKVVLQAAQAQRLEPLSNLYNLGPDQAAFSPPARLVFAYDEARLQAAGVHESDLVLFQYIPGQGWVQVPGQVKDVEADTITTYLSSLASLFGLFGTRDALGPRTSLAAGEPSISEGTVTFVTSRTFFILTSTDDMALEGDGAGAGTAFQEVQADTAPFRRFVNPDPATGRTFISTFTAAFDADGFHHLGYLAQDVEGNRGQMRVATVAVDATPPVVSVDFSTPSFNGLISPRTGVSLAAEDPAVNGVASGVERIERSLDNSQFELYAGSMTLADGRHALVFRAVDRLGNAGPLSTAEVWVDGVAPQASFVAPPAGGWAGARGPRIEVAFQDPPMTGHPEVAGSGVDPPGVRLALNGGLDVTDLAQVTESRLLLDPAALRSAGVPDGLATLRLEVADRLGNRSSVELAVRLDLTGPVVAITTPVPGGYTRDPRPLLQASFSDAGSGLAADSIALGLDGSTVPASVSLAGAGDGALSQWRRTASLPQARSRHGTVFADGYAYVLGGVVSGAGLSDSALSSRVGPDGELESWRPGPPLPQALQSVEAVASNGAVYVMGGESGSGAVGNVYYSRVAADGTLSDWQEAPAMPVTPMGSLGNAQRVSLGARF